jgi:hypothetical protein
VRSIESAPASHSITDFLRIILVIGSIGLLVPVVVLVATATRLAAARREQRLAALRLVGATPRQTATIAAVEATLAAVAATIVGVAVFFATRPTTARIPFDGATFYFSDLRPPLPRTATIALGVPALSVAAAIISLRRINVSPLGVVRAARAPRPNTRSLIPLASGLVLLTVSPRLCPCSSASPHLNPHVRSKDPTSRRSRWHSILFTSSSDLKTRPGSIARPAFGPVARRFSQSTAQRVRNW